MGRLTSRIFQTGIDVVPFEIRKVFENLLGCHAAGEHFEDMGHRHSHATNGRCPAANIGLDGDPVKMHNVIL